MKAPDTLSSRILARSTIWSLLGDGLPLLVALLAIPHLIAALGTERFGVLVIVWMVIGYFSLFDLGLGRSLTKFVAQRLGNRRLGEIPLLTGTAMVVMAVLGLVAGGVLAILAPWLVEDVLNIPNTTHAEAIGAMRWLALTMPFVITAAGMNGLLQAYQCFGRISAVRIPLGLFTFLGPLAVLLVRDDLVVVTKALALARVCAWCAYAVICVRLVPELRRVSFSWPVLRDLLRFGSWLTVSNVVGPLMVYFDRFFIGAVLTMGAVAYYATPYEVVTRLWVFPAALTAVAFPAMVTALAAEPERAVAIYKKTAQATIMFLFPVLLALMLFSHEFLAAWLGDEFAKNSTAILQILAVGVFINSFAQVPFSLIQGQGRADLTAKAHLIELPLYTVGLWYGIHRFGIEGAAIMWLARIAVDTIVMTWLSAHLVSRVRRPAAMALTCVCILSVLLGAATLISGEFWKVLSATLGFGACLYFGWRELGSMVGLIAKKA